MEWVAEARSWVGVVVGVVVAWITATWAAKGKRIEATATPYDKLAERVVKLETQVGELRSRVEHLEDENDTLRDANRDLRRERDRAHAALVALHDWIDNGMPPPPITRPTWVSTTPPTPD